VTSASARPRVVFSNPPCTKRDFIRQDFGPRRPAIQGHPACSGHLFADQYRDAGDESHPPPPERKGPLLVELDRKKGRYSAMSKRAGVDGNNSRSLGKGEPLGHTTLLVGISNAVERPGVVPGLRLREQNKPNRHCSAQLPIPDSSGIGIPRRRAIVCATLSTIFSQAYSRATSWRKSCLLGDF
jgi:hypothetical protein